MFPIEQYAAHIRTLKDTYRAALEGLPYDGVIIYSGLPAVAFQDDYVFPFKANPSFEQWAPLGDLPHCWLVVAPDAEPQLIYYLPEDYWHPTPEPPRGAWTECFDVQTVSDPADARKLLPQNLQRWAVLGEATGPIVEWGFPQANVNPQALVNYLQYARAYKTAYEVTCIHRANEVAVRGHRAARAAFEAGKSELGIHLAYVEATGQTDNALPYTNIVALNEHGAILHYTHYPVEPPLQRHSFLIDAGGEYLGYAADITRTYSAGSNGFGELISALDDAQQELIATIRPGNSYIDLHVAMHGRIAQILSDLGFVDMAPDAMVAEGVTSTFFPHGLGHHIGLQVHDVGGKISSPAGEPIAQPEAHPYLRNLRPIEAGHVFTIEPGIYFIDMLLRELRDTPNGSRIDWDKVDAFRKYGGVRIEDNVHVRADGIDNLTREAFAAA